MLIKLTVLVEDSDLTSSSWTPDTSGKTWQKNGNDDIVLYFEVHSADGSIRDGSSHYFNVTVSDPSASSSSTTTTSQSATQTSTSASSHTPTGSAPVPPPAQPSVTEKASGASSGLSTAATAGVAVGATIAGIAALAGLGFLFMRQRRKNSPDYAPATAPGAGLEKYATGFVAPNPPGIYEAPTHSVVYEAP